MVSMAKIQQSILRKHVWEYDGARAEKY
jgi:hypothetical protein